MNVRVGGRDECPKDVQSECDDAEYLANRLDVPGEAPDTYEARRHDSQFGDWQFYPAVNRHKAVAVPREDQAGSRAACKRAPWHKDANRQEKRAANNNKTEPERGWGHLGWPHVQVIGFSQSGLEDRWNISPAEVMGARNASAIAKRVRCSR